MIAVTGTMATVRAAVALVDSLADAADADEAVQAVLAGLERLIGCDVLTYTDVGPRPGQTSYADHPGGALDPATQDTFRRWVHQHPLINHYRATGDAAALRMSDVVSRWELHRLGLYVEFFARIPVNYQLAVSLPSADGHAVGLALNRGCQDFTDRERELLSLLRGPLAAGLARARRRKDPVPDGDQDRLGHLTVRERQVLGLAAAGLTTPAIGHRLGISPRTVAKHLEQAYRELGVANRAAATYRLRTLSAASPHEFAGAELQTPPR